MSLMQPSGSVNVTVNEFNALQHSYSLHKIKDDKVFGFSATDYSKFKFGDKSVARAFGIDLAKGFITDVLTHRHISNQIVVCCNPYTVIPPATMAMKEYFVYALNSWLLEHGYNEVQESHIMRSVTHTEDYGALNKEERVKLIGNDGYYMDDKLVNGKTILFLDDIKITGTSEMVMLKAIPNYQLADYMFLYFAELVNETVRPQFENELNFAFVKRLVDLEMLIKSGEFALNTRAAKFILRSPFEEFQSFAHNLPVSVLVNLYDQSVSNGFLQVEAYSRNLCYIKNIISE